MDKENVLHTCNGILLSHKKETETQISRTSLWSQGVKDGGRESQGAWDGHGHTAVFNMENQLLDSTGNSAQYSVITLWSPGGRMEEGIVRESRMDMDTLLCLT